MFNFKFGKKPARAGAISFALSDYADFSKLPPVPKTFGHEALIGADWGMLGNDQYGDCVWAGAAHETLLWNAEAKHPVVFSAESVLSDYASVTGFNPNNPDSDQGTDVGVAAAYRRKTGVLDQAGNRHQVAAYLALKPGNMTELYAAMYLFGAVGIGIEVPSSAMDQFNEGKPWSVVHGSQIEGGHYIPLVAKRTNLECVTWGKLQQVTTGFYERYCDEAVVYLSAEALVNGKSPEAFDYAQLQADLQTI
jgi:hypothetical protein